MMTSSERFRVFVYSVHACLMFIKHWVYSIRKVHDSTRFFVFSHLGGLITKILSTLRSIDPTLLKIYYFEGYF